DTRQTLEKTGGKVLANVTRCGGDNEVVVEQPFGRGRLRFAAAGIFGKRGVHPAKRSHVVVEPAEMSARTVTATWVDDESRRQASCVFLQQLDAEEFGGVERRRRRANAYLLS